MHHTHTHTLGALQFTLTLTDQCDLGTKWTLTLSLWMEKSFCVKCADTIGTLDGIYSRVRKESEVVKLGPPPMKQGFFLVRQGHTRPLIVALKDFFSGQTQI